MIFLIRGVGSVDLHAVLVRRESERLVGLDHGQIVVERHGDVLGVFGVGELAVHVDVMAVIITEGFTLFRLLEVDGQRFAQRDQVVERIDVVFGGRDDHRRLFGTVD